MKVGIDLDNTIIRYDGLLHRIAVERGYISLSTPEHKQTIRDYTRKVHGEEVWRDLQLAIYGTAIVDADLYEGVWEFLYALREKEIPFQVVSHKTQYPNFGIQKVDLRKKAMEFLGAKRFFSHDGLHMSPDDVFFCSDRETKVATIARLHHTVFIDDLEEVFMEPHFPEQTRRILFSTAAKSQAEGVTIFPTFAAIHEALLNAEHA